MILTSDLGSYPDIGTKILYPDPLFLHLGMTPSLLPANEVQVNNDSAS